MEKLILRKNGQLMNFGLLVMSSLRLCALCSTKYISGHEDVCAGVATASTTEQWNKLRMIRKTFGGILVSKGPFTPSASTSVYVRRRT